MAKDKISEEKLNMVNGGYGKEYTIIVSVLLPATDKVENKVTVYIDGQLESSLCNSYDSSVEKINLKIVGSTGNKMVDVKVNNIRYKTYDVNFDNGTYSEI